MQTGGNPQSATAIIHKITLFIKVENCDNCQTLLFNLFPVWQDDEDISKIHPANTGIRKYQSNE